MKVRDDASTLKINAVREDEERVAQKKDIESLQGSAREQMMSGMRERSRQEYLEKREAQKLEALEPGALDWRLAGGGAHVRCTVHRTCKRSRPKRPPHQLAYGLRARDDSAAPP